MDYSKITQLLELYWEGETSLEQEAQLKKFFNQDTNLIPEYLRPYQPLFRTFEAYQKETISSGFEAKMMAQLQAMQAEEESEKTNEVTDTNASMGIASAPTLDLPSPTKQKNTIVRRLRPLMSAAAILLLIIGSIIFYNPDDGDINPVVATTQTNINGQVLDIDNPNDRKKAFEATKMALTMLSSKINTSKKHLKHLNKFNQSTQILKPKNRK